MKIVAETECSTCGPNLRLSVHIQREGKMTKTREVEAEDAAEITDIYEFGMTIEAIKYGPKAQIGEGRSVTKLSQTLGKKCTEVDVPSCGHYTEIGEKPGQNHNFKNPSPVNPTNSPRLVK